VQFLLGRLILNVYVNNSVIFVKVVYVFSVVALSYGIVVWRFLCLLVLVSMKNQCRNNTIYVNYINLLI